MPRQHDFDAQASLRPIIGADRAAMRFYATACDHRQAGPVTARAACGGSAKEGCEQVGQLVFRDAAALIEDAQCIMSASGVSRRLDLDCAALRGMLERVADEVLNGAQNSRIDPFSISSWVLPSACFVKTTLSPSMITLPSSVAIACSEGAP